MLPRKSKRDSSDVFIQNLFHRVDYPFTIQDIEQVISLYYLGSITHGYMNGGVTLPYIDINGKIRAIQVKQFDENNHTVQTNFLHSILQHKFNRERKPFPNWLAEYCNQEKSVSCLFGEHLLKKYPYNPIALVEAPKTAIYGTLYFGSPKIRDNFLWLAVYNKSSFSLEKVRVLQGKDVYVFPDLSISGKTFREWQEKAKIFEHQLPGIQFIFSDLLERFANEMSKLEGLDLADYLIKLDWRAFRKQDDFAKI